VCQQFKTKPRKTENRMAKKVVIVESPTKARTIGRYLDKEYKVLSTVGHIRDLPKSKLGVDVEAGFDPEYVTIKGKAKTIKQLKDAVKGAEEVYVAPDPDREGEAIAWHVAELLKVPVKRVEFHEITRRAVTEALKNPHEIDTNRVNAQQARRVLDRLVGYKISPLMWRKIKPGLSAGRVQSVAVRLVCEREEEIRAFKPEEYWSLAAEFSKDGTEPFPGELVRIGDKRLARPGDQQRRETESGEQQDTGNTITIDSEEQMQELIAEITSADFSVSALNRRKHSRRPQPPFTTSTMQQDAARKLGWTARRTMSIAQQLYEGVELGQGSEGLISYMRTDSTRVNPGAIEEARSEISSRFGTEYLPEKANFYKSQKGAQEAHEAIRPTNARYAPQDIRQYLSKDQLKLYSLVYNRFIASQMKPAEFETNSVEISGGRFTFRTSATRVLFPGHLRVYGDERKEGEVSLPPVVEGDALKLEDTKPQQHFTKPPPRYTDATLVRALEQNGIGRPSTYAPIIETIIHRNYVVRVGRAFEPTEWGFVTTEMMEHYFPNVVDVNFTRGMEEELDSVEHGKADWREVLKQFYAPFSERLEHAQEEKRYFKAKPLVTEIKCDREGCEGMMVQRHGKYGRFLGCSEYPKCDRIMNLDKKGNIVDRPVTEAGQKLDRKCPRCDSDLVVKVSRWGTKFIGCTGYPKCDYTSELQTQCPKCGTDLIKKRLANRRVILVCKANEDSGGEKCDFVLWGKPLIEKCPLCSWFLAERKIRGTDRWQRYCSNPECANHKGISDDEALEPEEEAEEAAS
jgi:DNA topoisomerase-1